MGGMSKLINRTDSDRLDDLIEAAEKQTAAINRLAMAVQDAPQSDAPAALRHIRLMVAVFLAIFLLNGCYQEWKITLKPSSAAKSP